MPKNTRLVRVRVPTQNSVCLTVGGGDSSATHGRIHRQTGGEEGKTVPGREQHVQRPGGLRCSGRMPKPQLTHPRRKGATAGEALLRPPELRPGAILTHPPCPTHQDTAQPFLLAHSLTGLPSPAHTHRSYLLTPH